MMKSYFESDYDKAVKEGDYKWFLKQGFKLKISHVKTTGKGKSFRVKITVDVIETEKMLRIEIPKGLKEKDVRKMVDKANKDRAKKKNGKRTSNLHFKIHH